MVAARTDIRLIFLSNRGYLLARTYNVRFVAVTLGVQHKWLDNLLSHHAIPGVTGGRQGVSREIGADGLLAIELVRALVHEFSVPISRAATMVAQATPSADGSELVLTSPSGVRVSLSLADAEARIRAQMFDAIEATAHVRRGRPPGKR